MFDFNSAHSNSANASKRLKKKEKIKAVRQLAECEGKITFDSFKAAAVIAGQRRKEVRVKRNPYCCFYCRKYHIG